MATFTISQQPSTKNVFLYPDGNSSVSFTAVGDTTNYKCVDDTWDAGDESTYVKWSGISNATDIYTMQNTAIATGTINCVTLFSRVRSYLYSQHSTGNYKIIFDNGAGSRAYSDDLELSTGYKLFSKYYTENPVTSIAWTWANINAMFMGVECSSPSFSTTSSVTYRPNAAGSTTNIIKQYPSSGYHWDKVDEIDPDESTYVIAYSTGAGGQLDTYNIPNHTTETGVINNVVVYIRCKTPSGYTDMWCKPVVRNWGYDYFGSQNTLTSTWTTFSYTWSSRPSDSGTWTWADIDNLEIGVQLYNTHSSYYEADCTQVYAIVNYTIYTNPEIQTTQCYTQIEYVPAAETTTLNKPETYTFSNNREIKEMNFWNKDRAVYGLQRTNKTLTMNGCEWNTTISTATSRLETVSTMADNGDTVTLSGFTDPNINTTWIIKDFNYERDAVNLFIWNWNMTLEKT